MRLLTLRFATFLPIFVVSAIGSSGLSLFLAISANMMLPVIVGSLNVAVNVTDCEAYTGFADEVTVIVGGAGGATVTSIVFEMDAAYVASPE